MIIEQARWTPGQGWSPKPGRQPDADLVLLFSDRVALENERLAREVRGLYPRAAVLGCSTAGEILGAEARDGGAALTAVRFSSSRAAGAQTEIAQADDSYAAGQRLARALEKKELRHVLVLADAPPRVNGSELVRGLASALPPGTTITGGMAGDGMRFSRTRLAWDGAVCGGAAAVGLYGPKLAIACGSRGGWDTFGPERMITRSRGNVLYELDGKSALELYKLYLGDHARELPGAAVHYPLALRGQPGCEGIVRSVLAVDEADQSMTFAGDVPQGAYARMMKANFDRLIDGAAGAAEACRKARGGPSPLALMISCAGRKMVLGQRVEEELEAARDVLGPAALCGFYSYGEIAPFEGGTRCELHNETMTITTLAEEP